MNKDQMQQVLDALQGADQIDWDMKAAIAIMQAAVDAPTSGDYALGYAEGFNDACKPAPEVEPDDAEPDDAERCWKCGEDGGTSCGALHCGLVEGEPKPQERKPPNDAYVVVKKELWQEAIANCRASIAEEDISDARRVYRTELEHRLIAAPQERKPLTRTQLFDALVLIDSTTRRLPQGFVDFAREVEAAHGITGATE